MNAQRGFTLIELLAVTAIMIMITGVMLASNNRFGGQVLLQNLAYDIALSIRQAQQYGISVRQFKVGSDTIFGAPYGIHFQIGGQGATVYVLFADVNGNGLYDSGELVQSTTVGQGYRITGLCAPAGSASCASTLDVTFKRPEPDACISLNSDSPIINSVCADGQESASIEVASPRNDTKTITVEVNGQIAVN